MVKLRVISSSAVAAETTKSSAVDAQTLAHAEKTLKEIRNEGAKAVVRAAVAFGELRDESESAVVTRDELKKAYESLPENERDCLDRVARRIAAFAEAQKKTLSFQLTTPIAGGEAGHSVSPVDVAGCYAPGGRYPLPSSVLMTAVTAKAAGVKKVIVATPRPQPITLAAAFAAGADVLLRVGGAHAIAALSLGPFDDVPRADVVCGPGNKWVTAAKAACSISACVGIDMLAGPSEVLVLADETADPETVAADLLAQAEHDVVARPILAAFASSSQTSSSSLSHDSDDDRNGSSSSERRTETALNVAHSIVEAVNAALERQLAVLPTRAVAEPAVACGFAVACASIDEAVAVSDAVAPEHLEVVCRDFQDVADKCRHYGGLFVGSKAAEVLGDYGIGPNHTLPTSGTARYTGGLSVFHFLRIRTWMRVDDVKEAETAVKDAITLARLEGLEGHARAAEQRLPTNAGGGADEKDDGKVDASSSNGGGGGRAADPSSQPPAKKKNKTAA